MISRLIKTETDYETALARIERLMGAAPGTKAFEELELLSTLVQMYEDRKHPIAPPDPIDAIKFRMEQAELKPKDLVPLLGSRAKVSEVLAGKRPLSLAAIRALHEKLGIPAEILLREPTLASQNSAIPNPEKLPWKLIVEQKWLGSFFQGTYHEARTHAAALAAHLFRNMPKSGLQAAFYRRNIRGARIDVHALLAWTARVVNVAVESFPGPSYRRDSIDDSFMRALVSLSVLEEGPRLAQEFLRKNGISLVIEPHLPGTQVDGVAVMLDDGRPVVGLSLRHNRLDNFWYCLAHELAHLKLHLGRDEQTWFADNLDERDKSKYEQEADSWAENQLIGSEAWKRVKNCLSPEEVVRFALDLRISPSILAGRLRYEHQNYRLFSRLVGQGRPKEIFGLA